MKTLNTPKETAEQTSIIISKTIQLDGYFKIDYYTGDITIMGVYLPNGFCLCNRYNYLTSEVEYFDLQWNELSEYTQRNVLLEIGTTLF